VSKDTIHAPLCGAIHNLRRFYIQMNWLRRELMLTHHELTASRHELNCAAAQFIKAPRTLHLLYSLFFLLYSFFYSLSFVKLFY